MRHKMKGPIQYYSFGKFIINREEHSEDKYGMHGKGKDILVIDGIVSSWSQRVGHKLKSRMVEHVYGKDIKILIIGAGAEKALKCPKKVIKKINRHGIKQVIVKRTPKACKIYNKLYRTSKKVALLAHGTC